MDTLELFTTAQLAGVAGLGSLVALAMTALFRGRSDRPSRVQEATKRTRLVATFTARDSRGRVVAISQYRQYLDAGTWNDRSAERKGRSYLLTTDGRQVDKIGSGKYRVLGCPEILTSDDPAAL